MLSIFRPFSRPRVFSHPYAVKCFFHLSLFWSISWNLHHAQAIRHFSPVLSHVAPSSSDSFPLPALNTFFDKTYGFHRISYAAGVCFCCAVLVFTKHTCFIVCRAHFFDGAEKCSKHICFIGQDAKKLIFLLRGACLAEPPEKLLSRVRGALSAQDGAYCVCAVQLRHLPTPLAVKSQCSPIASPPRLFFQLQRIWDPELRGNTLLRPSFSFFFCQLQRIVAFGI